MSLCDLYSRAVPLKRAVGPLRRLAAPSHSRRPQHCRVCKNTGNADSSDVREMTNRSRPGFLEGGGGGLKEKGTKMELSDGLTRGAAAMDLSEDKSDVKTSKGVQYFIESNEMTANYI